MRCWSPRPPAPPTSPRTHPAHRRSAANLVHYLELRHHDVRDLQARLAAAGLSSLGRSEAHVLATIEEVLSVLARLNGHEPPPRAAGIALTEGHEFLAAQRQGAAGHAGRDAWHADHGHAPERGGRPAGARLADDRERHGHRPGQLRPRRSRRLGADDRPRARRHGAPTVTGPRIAMDLGGPKLRTGPLQPGPRVVRISPRRDRLGVVIAPALVWLTADAAHAAAPPASHRSYRSTTPRWLERRQPGDRLELVDSRDAVRHWVVVEVRCRRLSGHRDADRLRRAPGSSSSARPRPIGDDASRVGELPEVEQAHRVDVGDHVDPHPYRSNPRRRRQPAMAHRIGCTLPEVFDQAQAG